MDEMEESCSSSVQAHDVDSARQMIADHQDLKKRIRRSFSPSFYLPLYVCMSVSLSVSLQPSTQTQGYVRYL